MEANRVKHAVFCTAEELVGSISSSTTRRRENCGKQCTYRASYIQAWKQ